MPVARWLDIGEVKEGYVVGKVINTGVQAILTDPESAEYKEAREVMTYSTVREALDIMGLTTDIPAFERYELGWAFALMDAEPGLVDSLNASLRSGLNANIPIIFAWEYRKASCSLKSTVVGGKMFITLGTPALDREKLPSMFSGGYSPVLVTV